MFLHLILKKRIWKCHGKTKLINVNDFYRKNKTLFPLGHEDEGRPRAIACQRWLYLDTCTQYFRLSFVTRYTYFQNYPTCVVGTRKVFLVFCLPSIKPRRFVFIQKKLKMILMFQPLEYYRKKDKFASFQNLQSKDFTRASRFHIWLTAARTQKTRPVVSNAGRVILKIGVTSSWRELGLRKARVVIRID